MTTPITRPNRQGEMITVNLSKDEFANFDQITASLSIQIAIFQTRFLESTPEQRAKIAESMSTLLLKMKNETCGCDESQNITASSNETTDDPCFPFCTEPKVGCIPCSGGGNQS